VKIKIKAEHDVGKNQIAFPGDIFKADIAWGL
jgi:hypothetical protein